MSSYLTFSPLPADEAGGLFSVALSLPYGRLSLAATLPHGVRTFLAPAVQDRDRLISSHTVYYAPDTPSASTRIYTIRPQ